MTPPRSTAPRSCWPGRNPTWPISFDAGPPGIAPGCRAAEAAATPGEARLRGLTAIPTGRVGRVVVRRLLAAPAAYRPLPKDLQLMYFINKKYKIYHSERSEESAGA